MKTLKLFSWGYYGWGNATKQLIKAVDGVEQERGFQPPIFVDVRIRRSGRATGFVGSAFEDLLGDRHLWMPKLGNKRILSRKGKSIQIAQPDAVEGLLDLALKANEEKRRLIFFCGCKWSKWKGRNACHRSEVADLLIAAAKKRKIPVTVVEWPGDERRRNRMKLRTEQFQAVLNGVKFVPVPGKVQPQDLSGPAWGSIITFSCGEEAVHRLVGPLIWRKNRWHVQILDFFFDSKATLSEYEKIAREHVSSLGFDAQSSRQSTGARVNITTLRAVFSTSQGRR